VKQYKNTEGYPLDLSDGGVVPSAGFVELSADQIKDEHNAAHIEEGRLTEVSTPDKQTKEGGK
jgi:hypothetical protein